MDLAQVLDKAIKRREKLAALTNALRLVNGKGDGLDGLLIDRYHKHLQVQILADHWENQQDQIIRHLGQAMPVDYLIVKKRRGLEIAEEVRVAGESRTVVEEHGIKFEVDLQDGLNCGLFLDMRHNRRLVAQSSKGQKILNCFAYTCSFGVHAHWAGARDVVNVDVSRKNLERGKKNCQLNNLAPLPGEFINADAVSFLKRAFKKGNSFDMVILDPPSFARHEGGVFQVKRDMPKLMALAAAVLGPGGRMLVTTNYSLIGHADLERMLSKSLNGRQVHDLERVGQDEDFCGSNSFKESYLAGLWVRFL